jgi:CRP-like cAMP-binding protein
MGTAVLRAPRQAPRGPSSTNFDVAERVAMMCASALFTDLSEKECVEIASCARERTFVRDEILFMEGQPARSLVMIHSGSVKLSQLSPSGNEVILWMTGSSDPVGVPAEDSSCSHTCSARAMEQCKASVWEYQKLQNLMTEYPQIRKNISNILSGRLSELQERFREVATEKVAKRLALALVRLAKKVGKPAYPGTEVSLSRDELAQMTGTTLFTISRVLSKWAEEGFVEPRRGSVVVLDAQRLREVCNEDE